MSATTVSMTLDEWIAHEAIPFSLDSRPNFNAAVDKVLGTLADEVELLGFGEALHGGEELLVLRNQLFQRLVETHGYSAIAIESSFPRGHLINEYVLGRSSVSYETLQDTGFSPGFGKLEANRELVEWMKQYNSDSSHAIKLHFYGFDSPTYTTHTDSPRRTLDFALNYLSSVDATGGQEYRNRIEAVLGNDADWENPAAIIDPSKAVGQSPTAKTLRVETEELIAELLVRRPELVAKSDKISYREALHYAIETRQLLHYHAIFAIASPNRQARLLGIRDAIMADNLTYIVEREHERGKVMAFAHNAHLKRGRTVWKWGAETLIWSPVGEHLNEMFGRRYSVIGSAVGESPANGIAQPEAGTLEARLTATAGPLRFIPTHQGQRFNADEITALPTRSGSKKNGSYIEPLNAQNFTDFDWLAILDSVTYNRGGPPLETWTGSSEQ
jgi:erythromycin esterase